MRTVQKEYQQPFILEPTKLTRFVNLIHERLEDYGFHDQQDSFEVHLTNNVVDELTSLEEVLALENSRKQKIQRLIIRCSAGPGADEALPELVEADFDSKAPAKDKPENKVAKVSITVRSVRAAWASRTLSELEEQVERTKPELLGQLAALLVLIFLIVSVGLLIAGSAKPTTKTDFQNAMWLNSQDLDRVDEMLKQNPTLSEDQVREIVTRELRNVIRDQKPSNDAGIRLTKTKLFLMVPLVIFILITSYLLVFCYPSVVFLWGDEVERYNNLRQRRRNLWTVVVIGFVVNLAASLFFSGLVARL